MKLIASTVILGSSLLSLSSATSIRGADDNNEDTRNQGRNLMKDTRIIGGDDAAEGRYSYAVSLQDDLGLFCGGSLIARDVVLTAAHCAGGNYNVVIGRHDLSDKSGEVIPVRKEIRHPNYDYEMTNNDFNLVFLQRPTKMDVALVKLNSNSNVPSVGDAVTVMGWGDIAAADDKQQLSDVLQHVPVNVISNAVCEKSEGCIGNWCDDYNNYITSKMLCAKANNADSCQGDSGGPLVVRGSASDGSRDVQVGVTSWGIGCATRDFPGVYARVSEAYSWIKTQVCNGSVDKPCSLCGGCSNTVATTPSQPSQQQSKPSPPSPSPPSPSSPSANSPSTKIDGNWETLVSENFSDGYGFFKSGGDDTVHYPSVKGRSGVIRLQDGNGNKSSIYSSKIKVNKNYSTTDVIFSFMGLSMETNDSFCLDYSIDEAGWKQGKCWNSRDDFSNNTWNDGTSVKFNSSKATILRFRFRCAGDSKQDDLLIDKVVIKGLDEPF